jgi:integrase
MSFAFILPDACRAAEAALAKLTANLIARQTTCKLGPDDLDAVRGRITAARLQLVANEYLGELWPAPHVAIGLSNHVPLQYAVHVLQQMLACLDSLGEDLQPESKYRGPLADIRRALADIRAELDAALEPHFRRLPTLSTPAPSKDGKPGDITVAEVIEKYIIYLSGRVQAQTYAEHSFDEARRGLLRFGGAFGQQKISECRQHDLTSWYEANPQWLAVSTKKRIAQELLACFNWAVSEEYVEKSPYRTPRALRGVPCNVRRPAEPREYVMLMRHGSRALRRALLFLRRTGARTCEMRELRWRDVHLDAEQPHIRLFLHKTARITGKPRIIPLDATTARVLAAIKRNAIDPPGHEHVFLNCDGTPWDRHTFPRHLRRTAERIGLDAGVQKRVSAYCLRHSYAVDAIEAGVSTRALADVLGHAKTNMIDSFYGSHTRQRTEHLGNIAEEISRKRKKRPGPDGHDNNQPKGEDK